MGNTLVSPLMSSLGGMISIKGLYVTAWKTWHKICMEVEENFVGSINCLLLHACKNIQPLEYSRVIIATSRKLKPGYIQEIMQMDR